MNALIQRSVARAAIKEAFEKDWFNICPLTRAYDLLNPGRFSINEPAMKPLDGYHCKYWSEIDTDGLVVICYCVFRLLGGPEEEWDESYVRSEIEARRGKGKKKVQARCNPPVLDYNSDPIYLAATLWNKP